MKTMLAAAFLTLALPAYAATTHKTTVSLRSRSRPTTRRTSPTWRRRSS